MHNPDNNIPNPPQTKYTLLTLDLYTHLHHPVSVPSRSLIHHKSHLFSFYVSSVQMIAQNPLPIGYLTIINCPDTLRQQKL